MRRRRVVVREEFRPGITPEQLGRLMTQADPASDEGARLRRVEKRERQRRRGKR